MGLSEQIEEQAEEVGAKAEELREIKGEVRELKSRVQEAGSEVDEKLGEKLEESQDQLDEMIDLLKRVLKSMEVMEEMAEINNALEKLGEKAEDVEEEMSKARKKMSSVKWSSRIRTTMWQGMAVGIGLLFAVSILWTSTTLPQALTPRGLVLSEQDRTELELGNRYRTAYNGLSEKQQSEINALLKAGLQAQKARSKSQGEESDRSGSEE
jgi:formamidopyrimidine-DNA glycosylase